MSTVSRSIKRLRIEKGMTQDQLAEKMNVTRQAVSNWETEKTQPDLDTLNRLAELFGTDINDIIYGTPKGSYPRFQERYIRSAVIAFLVMGLLFFIHEWGPLYLKKLVSDIYWPGREHITLYDYMAIPILSEALCAIALGFFTVSIISLFYNTSVGTRIRKGRLLLAVFILLVPIILVVVEVILSHVSTITWLNLLYHICVKYIWLRFPLMWICPFVAGILFSIIANRNKPEE